MQVRHLHISYRKTRVKLVFSQTLKEALNGFKLNLNRDERRILLNVFKDDYFVLITFLYFSFSTHKN